MHYNIVFLSTFKLSYSQREFNVARDAVLNGVIMLLRGTINLPVR